MKNENVHKNTHGTDWPSEWQSEEALNVIISVYFLLYKDCSITVLLTDIRQTKTNLVAAWVTEKERRKMVNIISRNPNLSSIKIQAWSGSTEKLQVVQVWEYIKN